MGFVAMSQTSELHRDSIVCHSPDAVAAEVDGEVVALDAKRGFCFGLNRTGSRVWQLAAQPLSVAEICAQLTARFDIDGDACETDVLELLAGLKSEGLISVVERPPTA